jgi:hypothetical protein
MSEKKQRRRLPMSPDEVRSVFRAGHVILPLVGFVFIVGHLACDWKLSWELLVLLSVVLLPFILPLLGFYVGKIGALEINREIYRSDEFESVAIINEDSAPQPAVIPTTAPPPVIQLQAEQNHPDPNFYALTNDEQKVMRTLWKHQREYHKEGKASLWGFVIGSGSPDYRSFVRGVHSLMQRKLVKQDARGLAFLTHYGLGYADQNADLLEQVGDTWTEFEPAR